jgi:hypothetical protein
MAKRAARPGPGEARPVLGPAYSGRSARLARKKWVENRAGKHVLVQKSGLNRLRGKRAVPGFLSVPSFLSEPGPLIRARPARTRIEPGRAGLGPGPNNGLRAGLAGLVLIGHL